MTTGNLLVSNIVKSILILLIVFTFLTPEKTHACFLFCPPVPTTDLATEGTLQDVLSTQEQMYQLQSTLDGLAWSVAKQAVSQMTQSLIDWVNSGFQGNPTFVTDINGLLRDAADVAAGEYIAGLGDVGEFLCSPFSLDVQVALELSFAAAQSNANGGTAAQCTLTGIEDNLEGFLSGTIDSWDQWLQVTTNPQNTPYGAYLIAEQEMYARIQNEQGQVLLEATWGDGFLSKKICEAVEGTYVDGSTPVSTVPSSDPTAGVTPAPNTYASGGVGGANCIISTPGQVISQQLNAQLGRGQDALVEADEINELISALLNQLTLMAVEGVNGLLGLSSGTGYTDYSYEGGTEGVSYVDAATQEQTNLNLEIYEQEIAASLKLEQDFLRLINSTASSGRTAIEAQEDIIADARSTNDEDKDQIISDAESAIEEIEAVIAEANSFKATTTANINELKRIKGLLDNPVPTNTQSVADVQEGAIIDYLVLQGSGDLVTRAEYDAYRKEWQ